jgi:hypothetical protein
MSKTNAQRQAAWRFRQTSIRGKVLVRYWINPKNRERVDAAVKRIEGTK